MALGSEYVLYLIIGIIAIAILLTTSIIIIFRVYFRSRNKTLLYIVYFFVFLTIWAIGSTLFPILPEPLARAISIVNPISAYLGFFCLYLFVESINIDKPSTIKTLFFACTISITAALMIYDPAYLELVYIIDFGYYVRPSTLCYILQAIILIGVGIVFFGNASKIRKITNPIQKRQMP